MTIGSKSAVYPLFERIINVYHPVGDGTYTLATELGANGNISGFVKSAGFTVAMDKGCCAGYLELIAFDAAKQLVKLNNPCLLSYGDLIEFVPETGATPVYSGTVIAPREIGSDYRHRYKLEGAANQLWGVAPVDENTYSFGTEASATEGDPSIKWISQSPDGIVQWLMREGGPIDMAQVGVGRPANFDYTNMTYNTNTEVKLMTVDAGMDCFNLLDDLARHCPDDSAHDYPWPCIWGCEPDTDGGSKYAGLIYFNYRPHTAIMGLSFLFNPTRPEGVPVLTIAGTEMKIFAGKWDVLEGADFRNVLVVQGGSDTDGVAVEKTYTNTDSIAKYGQRKRDVQEVPEICSTADADRWAVAFFQRYADCQGSYVIKDVPITAKEQFVQPWDGFCQVTTPSVSGEAGERNIAYINYTWDDTPMASYFIGDGHASGNAGVGGSPRWGSAHKKATDRIPKTPGNSKRVGARTQLYTLTEYPMYPFWTGSYSS
jgi:hypothetical protein